MVLHEMELQNCLSFDYSDSLSVVTAAEKNVGVEDSAIVVV